MKPNVFLCVVDCMRFDAVARWMPWLNRYAGNHISFNNYWVSSHCTDPSITHLLSGKHPDELRLYSMMYDRRGYSIPKDTKLLSHIAVENGYRTAAVTNLGRWYKWGFDHFTNSRNRDRGYDFAEAERLMNVLPEPWFVWLHNADMHTNYASGTYQKAAQFVDAELMKVVQLAHEKDAVVFITADHGEGLGYVGPDDVPILQHGQGLWDVLTHVPLIAGGPPEWMWHKQIDALFSNADLWSGIESIVSGKYGKDVPWVANNYIIQAGATPKIFHRGVVYPDGRQFVRATYENESQKWFWLGGEWDDDSKWEAEYALEEHCESYGIEYGDKSEETRVLDRLKGLGYFD